MSKDILIDVDGLMSVLRAIKEGRPVEYRPLEERGWRTFDPANCEIDTENCKYRVKPMEYPDKVSFNTFAMKELEEDRIYRLVGDDYSPNNPYVLGYICVRVNLCEESEKDDLIFHFLLQPQMYGRVLYVIDDNCLNVHSEKTDEIANIIAPYIETPSLGNYHFAMATKEDVKDLEDILRSVGYKFENGQMIKL